MTDNYKLLFPKAIEWSLFQSQKPFTPFAEEVIGYLGALSASLLKDRNSRLYPDLVTFAFFCRKANLMRLQKEYVRDGELRLGRGVVFHIAPSNVPVNFAYSMAAGMLAGNVNLVRVSTKDFPQVDLIIKHMHSLSLLFPNVDKRLSIVRYDRTSDATAMFSAMSAVRVIWGGDATIANIRKNEMPPRSFDVCFADRYSIAAISAKEVLNASDKEIEKLTENFYNDTYLFDQNACSAPHLIFWLNDDDVYMAKERFWDSVHKCTSSKYELPAVLSVDKLTAMYRQAVNMDIKKEDMPDNYAVRVELSEMPDDIELFRCAGGYFSEKTIHHLDEIAAIVNNRFQTMAYYGISKESLRRFVSENRMTGLDRIVPIGETTAFSLTWDGYNLIDTLSRVCAVL